jgi:hypothetical protein
MEGVVQAGRPLQGLTDADDDGEAGVEHGGER